MKPLTDNGKVTRSYEGASVHPAKLLGSSDEFLTVATFIIGGGQCYRSVPKNKDWGGSPTMTEVQT